jgi:Family of unknown function (DUF6527)
VSPVVITIIVLLILAAVFARVLLKRKPPRITAYRGERVDDLPDVLKPFTVYLAGDEGHLWAAAMVCPCGCGERIELNLLSQARPCWTAQRHPNGTVTLMPSVWRQKGCKSHFFVRNGRIDWC